MIQFFVKRGPISYSKLFGGTEEEFLAIEDFFSKEWHLNDLIHRDDGPARIWKDGQAWCQNGKYHRTDGPAVIYSDGRKYWYIEGLGFCNFFNQFFPMKNFIKDKYPGE